MEIINIKEKLFKASTTLPFNYYDLIFRFMNKDTMSILDVGCGKGFTMKIIKKRFRRKRIFTVGVDQFAPYLRYCMKEMTHDILINTNIESLPFKDKSFDVILCLEVIEHLKKEDALRIIENLRKLARKQVIISTPVGVCHQEEIDNNPCQRHESSWNPEEFKKLGFKVRGSGLRRLYLKQGHFTSGFIRNLAFSLSYVFPLAYFFPKLAFQMVCVYSCNKNDN